MTTLVSNSTPVELRCPTGPKRLLGIMRVAKEQPRIVEGNLLELACRDCRSRFSENGAKPTLVLHYFNILGELVDSNVVYPAKSE